MQYPSLGLTRAVLIVLSINIITAVFTFLSLTKHHTVENRQTIIKNDSRSSSNSEMSLSDTFTVLNILTFKVQDMVKNGNFSPNEVSRPIKQLVAQMENIVDDIEVKSFLSQPVINNHSFSYIHNPVNTCNTSKINLLLVLPSAPNNFWRRQNVRKSKMADYVRNSTNNAQMLFFIGKPSKENYTKIQQKIDEEAKTFGDIVQEDFLDIYRNNRLKSVSMLRWTSTFCPTTKYVLRTDDDVSVNISKALSVIDKTAENMDNFILGRMRVNDAPERILGGKYYLSVKEYPSPTFPPYVLGGLLGYPISTAKLLYEAALRVEPIWLEDIYISGLCAPKVHVPVLTDPAFQFAHPL